MKTKCESFRIHKHPAWKTSFLSDRNKRDDIHAKLQSCPILKSSCFSLTFLQRIQERSFPVSVRGDLGIQVELRRCQILTEGRERKSKIFLKSAASVVSNFLGHKVSHHWPPLAPPQQNFSASKFLKWGALVLEVWSSQGLANLCVGSTPPTHKTRILDLYKLSVGL